ncbi:MAG: CBS domain-containing protein, partial [Elainellaceae cyanobacterium]
ITVRPEQDMEAVMEKMQDSQSRRMLVLKDGNLEGILSVTDIANWLQRRRIFGEDVPKQDTTFTKQQIEQMQSGQA